MQQKIIARPLLLVSLLTVLQAFPTPRKEPLSSSLAMSTVAAGGRSRGLFFTTPLVHSKALSKCAGVDVYIKLDCLQPSGSFKDRGMAHLITSSPNIARIVSSSGGNAGLAAATVAQSLGLPCTVVVPTTTKPLVVETLRTRLNATVQVTGENWNAADRVARELVASDASTLYVPPFEHELLWAGHSTVVDEICEQLPNDSSMEAMIVSAGGGGLLCGVLEGLERNNQAASTKVVVAETEGASSFAQAWQAQSLVKLNGIDTVATSLGALQVSPTALSRSQAHAGGIEVAVCSDTEAVDACLRFANDHRILIEPACGAALAAIYSKKVQFKKGPIVVEVCGGSGVNPDLLQQWKTQFGL